MPVPSSVPSRRPPVARPAPARARRSSSSSRGPWVALTALLGLAGLVVVGARLVGRHESPPAPAPLAARLETPSEAAPENASAAEDLESPPTEPAEAPAWPEEPAASIGDDAPAQPEEAPPPGDLEESPPEPSGAAADPHTGARRPPGAEAAQPSDWDRLNAKNEQWRRLYRPAKARVDRLQAEVAKLEEDAKNNFVAGSVVERIGDRLVVRNPDTNSPVRSYAERIQERLPAARRELAAARDELAAIEEAARKDGVASGQLY